MIKYKCFSYNKDYSNKLDKKLKKRFKKTFKFSNNDIEKFILLLRKGVYLYEYMVAWEKFNETTLAEKEEFYSNLNMDDITDADFMHVKRVCKDFEIKNLGEYRDIYLKSDTPLLSDVFENFRKMCLNIYHVDAVKFLSAPRLAWQAALKKNEVKLELLTDYDKNKEKLYLKYWDVNNLYGWAKPQKLPVNKFEWIGDTYQFMENFIKSYNEESDKGYLLQVDVQ